MVPLSWDVVGSAGTWWWGTDTVAETVAETRRILERELYRPNRLLVRLEAERAWRTHPEEFRAIVREELDRAGLR